MAIPAKVKSLILLSIIVAVALFFRFWRLDSVPPGYWVDIALNGNDAASSLQNGDYKVVYPPEHYAREGLMIWLDALSIAIFGITPLALKIPAAIFGTLTVLGIYLLARQMFGGRGETIPLLAAFFCAVSFWHVNFSRIGFRAILLPFCLVFAFYFLWRAYMQKSFRWAVAAGIFFGLGFYTYTPFAAAIPLLIFLLGMFLAGIGGGRKKLIGIFATMFVTIFFVALPLAVHFLQNREIFLGRNSEISVFSAPSPVAEAGASFILHLLMFNVSGDNDWRHNVPGAPELFWPVGVVFILGVWICITRAIGAIKKRRIADESIVAIFLLAWLFVMILPGALTKIAIPHSLRTIGALPAAMILAAVGANAVNQWMKPRFFKAMTIALAVVFLAAIALQSYWQYFVVWAKSPELPAAFTEQFGQLGHMTSKLHDRGLKTVVIANIDGLTVPYPDGIPIPAQSVQFAERENCYKKEGRAGIKICQPYSKYILLKQIDKIEISGKTAIVPMVDFDIVFNWLGQLYPGGEIKTENGFRYYEIEKSTKSN